MILDSLESMFVININLEKNKQLKKMKRKVELSHWNLLSTNKMAHVKQKNNKHHKMVGLEKKGKRCKK